MICACTQGVTWAKSPVFSTICLRCDRATCMIFSGAITNEQRINELLRQNGRAKKKRISKFCGHIVEELFLLERQRFNHLFTQ